MIEHIQHESQTLAIIIRRNYKESGIQFFTPDTFSQQLAYMNRPEGYNIQPHTHNEVKRKVTCTQEVLFIKSGKVRVDLYTQNQEYLSSYILLQGDVILLSQGGHGFSMLEDTEIIEVKQGPYAGDQDKTRFTPPTEQKLKIVS